MSKTADEIVADLKTRSQDFRADRLIIYDLVLELRELFDSDDAFAGFVRLNRNWGRDEADEYLSGARFMKGLPWQLQERVLNAASNAEELSILAKVPIPKLAAFLNLYDDVLGELPFQDFAYTINSFLVVQRFHELADAPPNGQDPSDWFADRDAMSDPHPLPEIPDAPGKGIK